MNRSKVLHALHPGFYQYFNPPELLSALAMTLALLLPAINTVQAAEIINWWQQRVDNAPLHPDSDSQISKLVELGGFGFGKMQIDFSIKVNRAENSDPKVPLVALPGEGLFLPDSDPAGSLIPLPAGASIESSSDMTCDTGNNDCHYIAKQGNLLYEIYHANLSNGELQGQALAIWDLSKKQPASGRGEHCTSADAAGFPMQPLLWNADEIQTSLSIDATGDGDLGHAIRFILPNARIAADASLGGSRGRLYVRPASHAGGPSGPEDTVAYGARLKLRADFPADDYNAAAKVVINTMKRYGIVLADGGNIALTAESDRYTQTKWSDLGIDSLVFDRTLGARAVRAEDFEVIDTGERIAETYECVRNDYQDTDNDGILDTEDNCTLVANTSQRDTDEDGFGNLCDGDLNNDDSTNTLDLSIYKLAHRSILGDANYSAHADFNGDNKINTLDLSIYKLLHRKPPGPSGTVGGSIGFNQQQRLIADQFISIFENGTPEIQYAFAEDIGDGRGITAGRAGFTSATGDMLVVIEKYTELTPANSLASYIEELKRLVKLRYETGDKQGSASTENLQGLIEAWKEHSQYQSFRNVQDEIANKLYYRPAVEMAKNIGAQLPLTLLSLYDTNIMHGESGLTAIIEEATLRTNNLTPKNGADEIVWLKQFNEYRKQVMLADKTWKAAITRVSELQDLIDIQNYQLTPFEMVIQAYEGETHSLPQ